MALELRPYQLRTLDRVWESLQVKLNVLITAPCSAGKTILFSKIIQRLLRENPNFRALILVDREILVTQSRDKLQSVAPELMDEIGIVCSSISAKKYHGRKVTIASRQTLINNLDKFEPVQLIIVDEAHLMAVPNDGKMIPDQFSTIITRLREYNPQVRLVGCTASPYRLGLGYIYGDRHKAGYYPYFDQVDAEITTRELLDGGFISPMIGRANTGADMMDDLKNVSLVGGEFNMGQLSNLMCKQVHVQSCLDSWREYAGDRKKTLIFCTTVEHAEVVAEAFAADGVPAEAIHSKLTPIESVIRMRNLKTGEKAVFTSVAKLTTGLDVSDIDTIILARPTKSTALYMQIIGRGARLADGKTDCLVLDLVGATATFGTDMDNLKVVIPFDGEGGEAPKKICPGENADGTVCGMSVHASLRYCPHCSFAFPVTEEVEAKIGKLEKVKFNEKPVAEPYTVRSVSYEIHESRKSGKSLIKVVYDCGHFSTFNEWVCLPDFYEGYAVTKAVDWWEQRSDEPFPQNCEEFIFLSDSLAEPSQVMVIKDGKFERVESCLFGDGGDIPEEFAGEYAPADSYSEDVPF